MQSAGWKGSKDPVGRIEEVWNVSGRMSRLWAMWCLADSLVVDRRSGDYLMLRVAIHGSGFKLTWNVLCWIPTIAGILLGTLSGLSTRLIPN